MLEKNQRTKSMLSGLLDVVLLRPVPRLKLPGLLGSYKKGEHLSEGDTVTEKFAPYMTFFRTGSIPADGCPDAFGAHSVPAVLHDAHQ